MSDETSLILRVRALGWAISLTRFNLLLLLMTTLLLSADQGLDLLLSMVQDPGLPWLTLFGGTLLWATSIWLWARVLLDIDCPDAPISPRLLLPYRKYLPRILGLLGFVAVTVNLYRACGWQLPVQLMAGEAALFFLLAWRRRAVGRWWAHWRSPTEANRHWAWAPEYEAHTMRHVHGSLSGALAEARGRIALLSAVLGIALLIWGLSAPLSLGQNINSLLMLMLWSATLLPLGSLLTYWSNRTGFPVVIALFTLALVFSAFNDNHGMRLLNSGATPEQRPRLAQALADWRRLHCDGPDCRPFILVATAGGGIRAAYWTGTVLGRLHDQALEQGKSFHQQVFAISGVSGGSVGATVYHAVARNGDTGVEDLLDQVLGQDYLGPISAGLLYPDTIQRLLPVALLPDRAQIFEQALETGFTRVLGPGPGMAQSFIQAGRTGDRTWPALFLNSTWSDNGRRIVAATLQRPAEMLYKDLLSSLGTDLRLSTAAHNSARFPFISPAGGWQPVDAPPAPAGGKPVNWQRLQDGGLFENFGAETALELLTFAEREFQLAGQNFIPLIIQISSNPSLPAELSTFPYNQPLSFAYETLSTFRSFANTRHGRGAEAASRLQVWTEARSAGQFLHVRMCSPAQDPRRIPLGWSLSSAARQEIKSHLQPGSHCQQSNHAAINQIITQLSTPGRTR